MTTRTTHPRRFISGAAVAVTRVLVLLLAATASAHAANLGWLRGAVVQKLTAGDLALLDTELVEALDFQPSGTVITWRNWRTGNWGRITPLEPFDHGDAQCRRVRIETHAGDASGTGTYALCRTAASEWLYASIE